MWDAVLGVDLGGTNIRAAAVSTDGTILSRRQCPTEPAGGLAPVLDRIVATVDDAATAAALPPGTPVGVALPGAVNPRTGIVGIAPNLHGWRDVPIRDLLSERLSRPVVAANDVNAAALGEWRYGAGRGHRDLIYLGIGTGVGGGAIVDGQLLLGQHGLAGEFGHTVVQLDGPPCHCGGRGCLEAFAAGWAITRDAKQLLDSGMPSLLSDLVAGRDEPLSGVHVALAARQQDGLALEILARAGHALGVAIASFVHLFNPEVVALGGGVIAAGELLFGPMHQALEAQMMPPFAANLWVGASELDQDAGLLGAAVLARQIPER